jgi:hypothetical protein
MAINRRRERKPKKTIHLPGVLFKTFVMSLVLDIGTESFTTTSRSFYCVFQPDIKITA